MSDQAIDVLVRLLALAEATPSIAPRRGPGASLYDADYRMALIALTFRALEEGRSSGVRSIRSADLKLIQFVAARPHLYRPLAAWARRRRTSEPVSLGEWGALPHGFATDETHDATIDYLLAAGALLRDGNRLQPGEHFDVLEQMADTIDNLGAFEGERQVVRAVLKLSIRGL